MKIIHQILWEKAEAIYRMKPLQMIKNKKLKISDLSINFKKLEKEEQIKPKGSRRKEIG